MWSPVCDLISLELKIERTDKMQTKHIEKLEELNDFEWEYKGKKFYLCDEARSLPVLYQRNRINTSGIINSSEIMYISLKNLTELEFYGLKVVLNKKPKLTRKERDFLEMLEDDIYIAKDEYGGTSLFSDEPLRCSSTWYVAIHECEDDECGILLNDGAFPFITWESGKAWSKSELMELEVVE